MNELIIGCICLAVFGILCLSVDFFETKFENFKEWLFDIGTSYYMHKARRARKRARR